MIRLVGAQISSAISRLRQSKRHATVVALGVAGLLLAPYAWAQVAFLSTWVGGSFNIVITKPRDATEGAHIDCPPSTPSCRPFNLAACTDPPLPVSFSIGAPAASQAAYTGTNQQVYAFLSQQSTCTFSTVAGQTGNNPNYLLGTASSLGGSSVFFTGGTTPFSVPQSLTSVQPVIGDALSTGYITTHQLLDAMGVCPPNTGTNLTTWFLCVGLDADVSAGINNGTSGTTSTQGGTGSDPVAYLQFQVDTIAPSAPEIIEAKPLNGRFRITGRFNTAEPDVYTLRARYSADLRNVASASGAPLPCDQWVGDVSEQDLTVFGQAQNTVTLSVNHLQNDKPYGVCLRAVDYMRNESVPSPTQVVTPRFECDLFACYPDTLHVGYCGGGATPGLMASASLLVLWRVASRRIRRHHRQLLRLLGFFVLCEVADPRPALAQQASIDSLAEAVAHDGPTRSDTEASEQAIKDAEMVRPGFGGDGDAPGHNPFAEGHRPRQQKKWLTDKDFVSFDQPGLLYGPQRERLARWATQFTLGPYRPQLTTSARGAQTFAIMYPGRHLLAKRPLAFGIQGEYYLLNRLGLGGPYFRVGFWQISGPSRVCYAADGTTPIDCTADTLASSKKGNDSQSLMVLPISAGLVYHFDYLIRRTKIPLLLTARAGLDNHLWWGRSGGRGATYRGHHAWGGTFGYTLAGGLAVNFNRLSRGDLSTRGNRVDYSLTAEYALIRGHSLFGPQREAKLDFTDNMFVTLGFLAQFR